MAIKFQNKPVQEHYDSLDNWGKVYMLISNAKESMEWVSIDMDEGRFNPATDQTPEEIKKQLFKTLRREFKLSIKKT